MDATPSPQVSQLRTLLIADSHNNILPLADLFTESTLTRWQFGVEEPEFSVASDTVSILVDDKGGLRLHRYSLVLADAKLLRPVIRLIRPRYLAREITDQQPKAKLATMIGERRDIFKHAVSLLTKIDPASSPTRSVYTVEEATKLKNHGYNVTM